MCIFDKKKSMINKFLLTRKKISYPLKDLQSVGIARVYLQHIVYKYEIKVF